MIVIEQDQASGIFRLSSCCLLSGFLSLIIACSLPMFVVTSYRGDGRILTKDFHADFTIGDGLWRRNVCHGRSKPDEDTLKKVGLSCKGMEQTAHCDDIDAYAEGAGKLKDRCDKFRQLQGLEIIAIFATFVAMILGGMSRSRNCESATSGMISFLNATSFAFLIIAISTASAVIARVKDADLDGDEKFECKTVFGAKLCHGAGPSYVLQWIAIAELLMAFIGTAILLCAKPTGVSEIREPLV